ncbi:MAG: VCBS repeat-containing protein, partial [Sulfurovum sp.]|nr:VCBS repeat-containing protein [Sulfurovum sp.]
MKPPKWLKPLILISTTALLTLTSLSANDFNNDGTADIPWRNNTGKTVLWYLNTDGAHTEKVIKDVSTSWTLAGTDDFNGDGITDI